MKLKTKDIKDALGVVTPGLAEKEFIEHVTSFTFVGGKVYAFNDSLCISHSIENCDLECVVQADLFSKYINKISAKEIEFTLEKNELKLKAGRSRTGFPIEKEIKLPLGEFMFEDAFEGTALPKDFAEAVKFVSESCDNNIEEAKLSSIHVSNKGFVEATDRMRLAHWDLEFAMEDVDSFLIPKKAVKAIKETNPTEYVQTDDWLHLMNGSGTVTSVRILNEEYMDTSKVLEPPKEKAVKIVFPDEIVPAVMRAAVFARRATKDEEIATITVMGGKIKIRTEAESGSWFEEFVSVDYKGKKFKFAVSIALLIDMLKKTDTGKIHKDRITFSKDSWIYLSMLRALPKNEK